MRSLKKLLAIFLLIMVVTTCLPSTAFAATISSIEISGIEKPKVGSVPNSNVTINSDGIDLSTDATFWVRYDGTTFTDQYDDNKFVNYEPVREGEKLLLQIFLTPESGNTFSSSLNIKYGDITIPAFDMSNPSAGGYMVYPDGSQAGLYIAASDIAASPTPTTHTVTFDSIESVEHPVTVTVDAGEYTLPACTFSRPVGKQFKCWSIDGAEKAVGDIITVTSDITVKAVWEDIIYTVTVVSGDESKGTVTGGGSFKYGEMASFTVTPKEGYKFDAWYNENGTRLNLPTNFGQQVTNNIYLEARFYIPVTEANAVISAPAAGEHPDMTPEASDPSQYTVTLKQWYWIDGSIYKEMSAEDVFVAGEEYELRVVFAEKDGYKFEDTVAFTVNGSETEVFIDADTYSTAKRKIQFQVPAAATYPVTIEMKDGDDITSYPLVQLSALEMLIDKGLLVADFSVQGFRNANGKLLFTINDTFIVLEAGLTEQDYISYTLTYQEQMNVKANTGVDISEIHLRFQSKYVVSFETNGGSSVNSINVYSGEKAIKPADPTKDYYAFAGWYSDINLRQAFDFNTPVTEDITLFAKWNPSPVDGMFLVTLDLNGGTSSLPSSTEVPANVRLHFNADLGDKVTPPSGKVFAGYEIDGEPYTPGDSYLVTHNFTLKLLWKNAPTTYTVSFAANGGSGTMSDVTGVSGEYTLPACAFTAPTGKQFKSWEVGNTEKAVGDKIEVAANIVITAVWEDIPAVSLYGDVNKDGKVNNIDATYVLRYSVGGLTEEQLAKLNMSAGDVKLDGKINNIDATIILRYSVGSVTKLPYES